MYNMPSTLVEIDISDALRIAERGKDVLEPKEINQRMRWALQDTARRAKTITGNEVPKDYVAEAKDVTKVFRNGRVRGSGASISCTIPLSGPKWTIGGNHVSARGGVPGWEAKKYAGIGYKITAQILKGKSSTLPPRMKTYGGQPPFINTAAPKLHNAVFTREGKSRFPIRPVAALGVPQMPPNRSKDNVEEQIAQELLRQVEARFKDLL